MSHLKIGTRDSQLAIWQAELLKGLLANNGVESELVLIKSEGDLNTQDYLHAMSTIGVFTKALDDALLDGKIDVAVHSCKDMPTELTEGIHLAAYLERDEPEDVLVLPEGKLELTEEDLAADQVLGTGSLRRKAQWLNRYPNHKIDNLRGNVNTRLRKLQESNWLGAIFSKSGLSRLGILPPNSVDLNWMVPAPAQGVVAVVCRSDEHDTIEKIVKLNHRETAITSSVERSFMNVLEGGCSAPIGAKATLEGNNLHFHGTLHNPAGDRKVEIERTVALTEIKGFGANMAREVLETGGLEILEEIKNLNN